MSAFARTIAPHVERELDLALCAESGGEAAQAFAHLERAHVLGQASTFQHVRVHWRMLRWGVRHRRWRECLGQVIRILGAATKTGFGLVPTGNTGGSNISPFKPLPVDPELAAIIRNAQVRGESWRTSRQ